MNGEPKKEGLASVLRIKSKKENKQAGNLFNDEIC